MTTKKGVDELASLLNKTNLDSPGVSFSNRSLKINTDADAQEVVAAMQACGEEMEFLNLEGNTIGVEGAEALARQLENHPKLKRAIWRDMFTGRSKTEIPPALKALSKGLMKAGAQLEVLELSDNASGPIGVEGIQELIQSPTCYTLKELKLNNMGLGISGGKMLAAALKSCYDKSCEAGQPLSLKVFIAGRNRLENDGAEALSKVFSMIGTLEVVQMPQNGIYAKGALKLFQAFELNKNLKVINLNDNTLTEVGAQHLANLLPSLPNLVHLDVGDCLLKDKGAFALSEKLPSCKKLEDVCFSGNEIEGEGGLALFSALISNPNLKSLKLNENSLGSQVVNTIKSSAAAKNKADVVNVSDDEGSDIDDEDGEEEVEEEEMGEEDDGDYETESGEDDGSVESDGSQGSYYNSTPQYGEYSTVSPLRRNLPEKPIVDDLIDHVLKPLDDAMLQDIITKIKSLSNIDGQIETFLSVITAMSVQYSSTINEKGRFEKYTMMLYEELFQLAKTSNKLSHVTNLLPAYVGLIKNEEKKPLVKYYNKESSIKLLEIALSKNFVPEMTKSILNFIMKQNLTQSL